MPKGVEVQHGGVSNLLAWMRDVVSPDERAGVLGSTSTSFDVSVAELWDTLCNGGRIILATNALDLAGLPGAEEVRLGVMVPTAAAELLRIDAIPANLASLNLAGEALPGTLVDALAATGTVRTIRNLYGPTEATVYATWTAVMPGEEPTIGKPVPNTQAHVLDASGRPVPPGVIGELYLGGAQVARGYLRRPALTAERFIPNPFSTTPGARMYATGDRVRWTREGEIDFLGRTDFQVKVRGFRIELGEIEAALRTHPAVADAVCAVRPDEAGAARLLAWVVTDADAALAVELRTHLRDRLPEYMVPAAIGTLAAFPLTSNGKVDTAALVTPDVARVEVESVGPRNETERTLAELFGGLLRTEKVGVFDNFFDLGGDSILSIQLVSRARERGLQITTRQVFQHQSVAGLAAVAVPAVAQAEEFDAGPAFSGAGLDAAELDELMYALGEEGLA